jgi:hypothetical protein
MKWGKRPNNNDRKFALALYYFKLARVKDLKPVLEGVRVGFPLCFGFIPTFSRPYSHSLPMVTGSPKGTRWKTKPCHISSLNENCPQTLLEDPAWKGGVPFAGGGGNSGSNYSANQLISPTSQ